MIYLNKLPNPLPSNYEVDIYLTLCHGDDMLDAHLSFYENDMSSVSNKYQLLSKAKVVFEIGDIDIPGIQIESLKKQKQQILADAHVKAEQIEQQIQSLLAIEYQPVESDGVES